MTPGPDLRFALVEDAAALLKLLPPSGRIVWPTEAGDMEALDEAFADIAAVLPGAKAAYREHKREVKARAALRLAMANGPRP